MKIVLIVFAVLVGLYIASLVYLVLTVGWFTSHWKDKTKTSSQRNEIVYVALGDSAAQGVGAITANGGYVGQFAKRLEAKHGRPVRVINISKSGAKVQDVINDQLPLLKGYKADVITLDIGGNDIATFDASRFKSEFTELVSKLPAGAYVADVPFFGGRTQLPFFGSGQAEKFVLIANEIIVDVTKDKPLTVVPMHQVTKERNGRQIWYYAPDYFHPNDLGYRAWTDAFWDSYTMVK